MDLFADAAAERTLREAPLAVRMRPRSLDEFVGQQHILAPGCLLRRCIEADRLTSMILWGPPGSGKTTLAQVIAQVTGCHFERLNAISAGVTDVRRVISEAAERRAMYSRRTILFLDEIHRFNKAQQDALLGAVEDGTLILIGATTENPMMEVNTPLLSRTRLFRLQALDDQDLQTVLTRSLADPERGLGGMQVRLDEAAAAHIVLSANGDARRALNALELAVLSTPPGADGVRHITLNVAVDSTQQRALAYDRQGDQHYDVISAFIKSMRGSDPDATLYWLARMLYAGEDPRFVARRLMIHAAEDVGNADPQALVLAVAAAQALERVGMPEARIPLAQAALYIATAPKSNSVVKGIDEALAAVQGERADPVPSHLRDASYPGAARLGHGKGYLYPHDYDGHFVAQEYLPDSLRGARFYEPSQNGYEAEIARRTRAWKAAELSSEPAEAES